MAQSNSNESRIKRERYTFTLAKSHGGSTNSLGGMERLISTSNNRKKKIDIENLLNPTERYHPLPPALENPPKNEADSQKTSRLERKIRERKRYDDEEMASIKSETKKFNGMRLK